MNTNQHYSLFSSILDTSDFSGYSFIFIYHLNENNEPFLKRWINKSETLGIISIPYSEVPSVKDCISKYSSVITPKSVQAIPNLITEMCNSHQDKKIILIEVGGYSSHISEKLNNVVLSIEDTHQGHWLQHNNKHLKYPVVSIANSEIKKLENRLIGESIVRTIERITNITIRTDTINNIVVFSYGGIGSSVCMALKNRRLIPYVYDIDVFKTAQAFADGYKIGKREQLLKNADIIIGCTGKHSIFLSDIPLIKESAYIFSGSSKQIEFSDISQLIIRDQHQNDQLQTITIDGKKIIVGYYGQPINFLDTVDPKEFEIIMSCLLECCNYGLSNKLENKVYTLPLINQRKILQAHIDNIISILE
ncbi:MAG: hypothetical protein WCO06_06520 [Candidatus Roizmanbacteria bacterium]